MVVLSTRFLVLAEIISGTNSSTKNKKLEARACRVQAHLISKDTCSHYTEAPVVGTSILWTHYIVSCDAEVCEAERESSRKIQGRMH